MFFSFFQFFIKVKIYEGVTFKNILGEMSNKNVPLAIFQCIIPALVILTSTLCPVVVSFPSLPRDNPEGYEQRLIIKIGDPHPPFAPIGSVTGLSGVGGSENLLGGGTEDVQKMHRTQSHPFLPSSSSSSSSSSPSSSSHYWPQISSKSTWQTGKGEEDNELEKKDQQFWPIPEKDKGQLQQSQSQQQHVKLSPQTMHEVFAQIYKQNSY